MSILDKLNYLPINYDNWIEKNNKNSKKLIEAEMISLLKKRYTNNAINDLEIIPPPIVNYFFFKSIDNIRNQNDIEYVIKINKDIFEKYGVYNNLIKKYNKLNNILKKYDLLKKYAKYKNVLIKKYDKNKKYLQTYLNYVLKTINLIEKNKDLFEKYGIYKNSDILPTLNSLILDLHTINLIENNKDLFKKYGIYQDGDKLPLYENLKAIKLIEENPILKLYTEYNDLHLLKNITVDKVVKDINRIKEFHNASMKIKIPKTFYISGLFTFAVYENIKLNKKIYLLGEHHNYEGICDMTNKTDNLPVYNANNFFFLLLGYFIKDKTIYNSNNKLDVFLELYYNPVNNKFLDDLNDRYKPNSGYMNDTLYNLYSAHCKPQYIKNKKREEQKNSNINIDINYELCLFEPYVRYHHSDLRDIDDEFTRYINDIYALYFSNNDKFTNKYSSVYDNIKLLDLYRSSKFINKINKQIKNISNNSDIKYIQKFFKDSIKDFDNYINSGDMNYNNVLKIHNNNNNNSNNYHKKDKLLETDASMMDLYLLGRVFRSFDKGSYNSTNIIIYTGNNHIKNYIRPLKILDFEEKYRFNSTDLEKRACLKVDNFDMEYFLDNK